MEGLSGWISDGLELGERERSAASLMWDIGDWWNDGVRYRERKSIVTAGDWTGPRYKTCRNAGSTATAFSDVSRRRDNLSFDHHKVVTPLSEDEADGLLDWCLESDPPHSVANLTQRIKQLNRQEREEDLAAATSAASVTLGTKLYGVIYADPPWRFEPYSRDTGMDRAADNHYPTMSVADIGAIPVPAADDSVLFMWATVPMLPEALEVMAAWGFEYKSHCVWSKDRIGTGYWFRSQHELLLVGTRGDIPAPAPGTQYASVINGLVREHSVKPAAFAEMIEDMFPHAALLEMFARAPRLGWDVWGNQAAPLLEAAE